jgi:uncharacterized membrane protein YjfL (UPF0719 family)
MPRGGAGAVFSRPMGPSALYFVAFDAGVGFALVTLALVVHRAVTGRRRPGERNLAESLVAGAHLLAAFAVVAAALDGCVGGDDLARDLAWTALFGGTGVLLLELIGRVGTGLILGARLGAEIARGNAAAGLAAAAHWLATGILVSSCLYGRDLGGFGVSLAFLAVAELTLHAFVVAFRALTVYDDREEILDENLAAALSYAGVTVGLGVIIGHAADGTFSTLAGSLRAYAVSLAGSLVFYPVRQLLVGGLLVGGGLAVRGGRLDEGIARGRAVGLAALEAASYLAAALAWVRLT